MGRALRIASLLDSARRLFAAPGSGLRHRADPAEEAAFAAHAAALTHRNGRGMAVLLAAADVLWWPLDRVLERPREVPVVFERWRAAVLVLLLGYIVADLAGLVRRSPAAAFALTTLGGCAILGGFIGGLGHANYPYFFFLYSALSIPAVAVFPIGRRALLAAAMVATLFASFFLLHPENLASPTLRTSLSYMIFCAIVTVVGGHLVTTLTRQNFFQARALAELNDRLEDRVREQTDELRRLSRHLQTAIEEERGRISREVHDELGQELTAVRFALSYTRARFEREPAAIGENLAEVDLLLARSAQTTRSIVTELRPRILDELGLIAAAEWLLSRTRERSGLACRFTRPEAEPHIPADVSIAAFRVLQEALTNVMRHARASAVEVTLAIEGDAIELRVLDDGEGIGEGEIRGNGIVGMRERARALGGELVVRRRPRRGTEVEATLPIDGARARPEGRDAAIARPDEEAVS